MIESIQIKNFRGIQTGQIDRFRKFNLLLGPNNSGKSAVMEMLYLSGAANRKARLTVQQAGLSYDGDVLERDFLGDDPMARVLTRHNYADLPAGLTPSQNALRVDISGPPGPLPSFDIDLGVRHTTDEPYPIGLFSFKVGASLSQEEQSRELEYFDLVGKLMGEDVPNLGSGQVSYCWAADLAYNQSGSAVWAVKDWNILPRQTLFYDVSNTLSHLPMSFFRKMIVTVPGWSQKIARAFSQVIGVGAPFNVQFLTTDREQKWAQGWIAPEDQIAMTIDSYGDGARMVFKLLTPLLALAEVSGKGLPGLFIWEEPELFQNPRALGQLLAEVASLMKDKPMQLFIATHSLEVVAHFTSLVQEGKVEPDDLMAFRFGLEDGKLNSSWFSADNLIVWLEEGLDPRVLGDLKSPLQFSFREEGEQ